MFEWKNIFDLEKKDKQQQKLIDIIFGEENVYVHCSVKDCYFVDVDGDIVNFEKNLEWIFSVTEKGPEKVFAHLILLELSGRQTTLFLVPTAVSASLNETEGNL